MNKKCRYFALIIALIVIFSIRYYTNIIETVVRKESIYKENTAESLTNVILIEVDKKKLSLVDISNGDIISTYSIATGKDNSPTPLGNFKIIKKAVWGEGFGSGWLGLDIPWGNYGIHGTNKPGSIGSNASAGCIRMRNPDIEDLYDKVKLDTRVIIRNGDYGIFGNGFRILKPGDRGSDVLEVQKRLNQAGFYLSEFDGIYGEEMKKSLIDFLNHKNIPLTDKIGEEIYKELNIILME